MKKTIKKEWRESSLKKLYLELANLKKETIDLGLEKRIGKLGNLHDPRMKRKAISTILTIIGEKKFLKEIEDQKVLKTESKKEEKEE